MCILFSFSKKGLGNVCQDMWNSAGNNLKIGKEIIINSGTRSKPLITLTQQGKRKVRRDVFVKFKGDHELFEFFKLTFTAVNYGENYTMRHHII